jgi:hypothetical protein
MNLTMSLLKIWDGDEIFVYKFARLELLEISCSGELGHHFRKSWRLQKDCRSSSQSQSDAPHHVNDCFQSFPGQ